MCGLLSVVVMQFREITDYQLENDFMLMASAGEVSIREETFQHITSLKDGYLSKLMELDRMYVVPNLTKEHVQSLPSDETEEFNSRVRIKKLISEMLEFLQMQKSHVYDSLAEKLPKYKEHIQFLLSVGKEIKAEDAKMNTGYGLQNCCEQPQMVNLTGSAVRSPGSKRCKHNLQVGSSSPAAPWSSLHSMWRTLRSESVPPFPDWTFLQQQGGSSSPNKLKRVFEHTTSPPESPPFENIERQKIRNEIKTINSRLIDTEISITDDSGTYGIPTSCDAGTTIKISYTAVAFSPDLKPPLAEFGKSIVMPVKLFVPPDYPRSSPMLIFDKVDDQLRKKMSAISDLVDVAFLLTLDNLPEPWSIQEIATAWDTCVRKAMIEFAHRHGGGTFSSRFGGWKRSDGS
ncbi:uncharacterized protein LOC104584495 isoform X2 [Brachypodium distachyon]|uniref:uncharacterized protein LOC104584495 isoform X2 n=1 Tax=Brachypodium distachyon TaxID=15368 RepID=UPI00071C8BD0|nr:uncharacterized protein LOC104584495 isoform X2 [Brachypodium distachyon]|eukprot:XP_014757998.1 uncharacterized protein LOC104584495 isoform X2 [Brachypodium distachyon]